MSALGVTTYGTQLASGATNGLVPGEGLLVNGQLYAVQAYAVDTANNPGFCSTIAYQTPYEVDDFWRGYKNAGGAGGGCSQSAGPLALLGLAGSALAFSLRRRKDRR
jgi:hypothetical protein